MNKKMVYISYPFVYIYLKNQEIVSQSINFAPIRSSCAELYSRLSNQHASPVKIDMDLIVNLYLFTFIYDCKRHRLPFTL